LVINTTEAILIQRVFQRYAELQSITGLLKELRADYITTKSWTTQQGHHKQGKPVDKGTLYKWLHNRVYLGELRHKEQWYPGKHEAIIDQALWDKVHALLKEHHRVPTTKQPVPFLLKGLLFDEAGYALTTWSSTQKKSGRRYRYYLSTHDKKGLAGTSGLPRFPAAELESVVVQHIRQLLRSESIAKQTANAINDLDDPMDEAQVSVAMTRIDAIWEQLFPDEQRRIVQLLVDKIIVTLTNIDVRLKTNGIEQLALEVTDSATQELAA